MIRAPERIPPLSLAVVQMCASRAPGEPRGLSIAHFFNHQTHRRGQTHAMLTAAGRQTGDTDLFLLV